MQYKVGYPIKELSRVYRTKIKNMLKGGSELKFNKSTANAALKQTIFFYFARRDSKQIFM